MTVNLYRIDSIKDYDTAIEALSDYVEELVDEFVQSPEGKAYLKTHPEMEEYVGSWIDHLLYFGYAYESVTLPRMTKDNVDAIVTRLFPNKVSLLDPEEANTTIPELTAFWQFLKRQYQHPKATQVLKFLKKIQPQFKEIMNDPHNFGIAKSFFMAGTSAGFDMTTEEGLKEFQKHHNQNLAGKQANSPFPGKLGMLGSSPPSGNTSEIKLLLQEKLQELFDEIEEEEKLRRKAEEKAR